MKRFSKVLALLLAALMLVTMATACKKNEDDALNSVLGNSGTTIGGNNTGNDGSNENDGNGNTVDPSNPSTNNGTEGSGNSTQGNTPGNQTQQGNADTFDSTKKYDMASNPLLAENKAKNTGTAPSFDIDTTGFVKNGLKVEDLKGKTLTLITALESGFFYYYGPNGEMLDEWDWFDSLKKTYGLNIKYLKSRFDKAPTQCVTYMNAGKALDIIPTHRAGFPQYFMLSRALDPYVNMQYVNNSPGVDNRTLEQTKWDGTYRCISPIGAVDLIWYNETMVNSLGLQDPHTLWEQGKWDWAAFESFQKSVPLKTPDGKNLTGFAGSMPDLINFWPRTNGVSVFDIKEVGGKTQLVHNFKDARSQNAMLFVANTCKANDWIGRRTSEDPQTDMYINGSCIMATTLHLMGQWSNEEYAKTQQYNWVPYPKGPDAGGENICMNYGATMTLPKKTKSEANIPYAVKFMELWANRFTEAIYDYLDQKCYGFSYQERKDYFTFATQHNYFENGNSAFDSLTGNDKEYFNQFRWSFYNPKYNTATTLEQVNNIVDKAVAKCNEFGT